MADVAGFVLAGGKSSRMGRDKAFLEFEGKTLLARALETLAAVTPQAAILGPRSTFGGFGAVVEDVYPGRGPLGGIHAALASEHAADLNLILAVDLPFVTGDLLRFIVDQARQSASVATVPYVDGGWQPVCAVYRQEFVATAERALASGSNKIDAVFAAVPVCAVTEDDLIRFAFSARMFDNLNTPADLARARQRT